MKEPDIDQWTKEVRDYLEPLNELLKNNDSAKELYFGFDVWDSKLVYNPEIMFIGINPGSGNGVAHHEVKTDNQEWISYLERNEYRYPLAEETLSVLASAGFSDDKITEWLTNKCVKTNYYYLITKGDQDIKTCINSLGKGVFDSYFNKSSLFTNQLIKILQPKIVNCEGKQVYDNLMFVCERLDWKDNPWKDSINHFRSTQENIDFIGYARHGSRILNKEGFAILLKEVLSNQKK